MTQSVRILVVDDQTVVREGLATMLDLVPELTVVATAGSGAEALRLVAEHDPDVVLMDLRMPGMDGVEATRRIHAVHARSKVVVLTTFGDEGSVRAGLQAGAIGYLTKEAGRDEIARAVHTAVAGQAVLDPDVARRLAGAPGPPPPSPPAGRGGLPDGLTPREGEVLGLIGGGLTNREIAAQLFISEATVKTHINNLFAKANLRDRVQAARYAFDHGLVPDV